MKSSSICRPALPGCTRAWAAVDRAGETAAGAVAASALLGAQRTDADGAVVLQHVVSLVRGAEHGRRGLGRDHFQQEPRPLAEGEIAEEFFAAVLDLARAKELLSDEHFTVDGTMVEGWASLKSFQPKDESERSSNDKPDDPGNPTVNFHGQKRSNKTHQSTTDADLRLCGHRPLQQLLRQLLQQPVLADQVFGLFVVLQQIVNELVVYGHLFSFS